MEVKQIMSTGVEKMYVLDEAGLDVLLQAVFQIVEDNYVRRTTYESDMRTLNAKINALDVTVNYAFDIDTSSGYLVINVPDEAEVDLSINEDGYLILNSNETTDDNAVARYSFNIDENGYLIATV